LYAGEKGMRMNKQEFLVLLDEIVEVEPGTIKESDVLKGVEGWDSMAVMGLIAMADEKFGVALAPEKIAASITVADIVTLLDGQIR
jgi:acyl carrier protein